SSNSSARLALLFAQITGFLVFKYGLDNTILKDRRLPSPRKPYFGSVVDSAYPHAMESLPDARAAAPIQPDTLPSVPSRNEALARLPQLAASLLDVPCAMLLRIHADRYEVRSSYVTKQALANQAETLFPAVVASGGAFLLDDSLLGGEEEGADSNGYTLKFLYCVPVTSETGALLGTLCLADARSHPLDDTSQHLLSNLATMISMELVHRDTQEAGETGAEPAPEERDDAYNKAWWNLLVENNPTPLLIARGDVVLYMNRAG